MWQIIPSVICTLLMVILIDKHPWLSFGLFVVYICLLFDIFDRFVMGLVIVGILFLIVRIMPPVCAAWRASRTRKKQDEQWAQEYVEKLNKEAEERNYRR